MMQTSKAQLMTQLVRQRYVVCFPYTNIIRLFWQKVTPKEKGRKAPDVPEWHQVPTVWAACHPLKAWCEERVATMRTIYKHRLLLFFGFSMLYDGRSRKKVTELMNHGILKVYET